MRERTRRRFGLRNPSWTAGAVVTVLALLGACAGGGKGAEQTAPEVGRGAARYPHTEADVRFMSGMIAHHAQAVEMARLAATNGAGPAVRRLAERIVNGQQDEIATMRRWLDDRGRSVTETGHEHHMPGMATEAELKRLAQARGDDFDRLFLVLMIRHHRGAVSMVRDLFATQGAAQDETVFKFASDVQVDQSTEVARMERMLSSLPSGDRSS